MPAEDVARLAQRFQDVLRRLSPDGAEPLEVLRLGEASDDEIFDIIDNQLGLA